MKLIITLVLFIYSNLLSAQNSPKLSLWHVTFHVGPFASGITNNMEEQMRSQGYQPYKGFLGTGSSTDMTYTQPVFQFGIEKIGSHNWSGKLLVSRVQGYTTGISSQEGDLKMVYQIFTSALLAGYHSKQNVTRISFGPSLNLIRLRGDKITSFVPVITKNKTKIGLMVEAGFRFPPESRLFFDFNTQYNYVDKQDFGTFLFRENTSGGQSSFTSTFVAGKHSFNYFAFNFGLGLRLGNLLNLDN